MRDCAAPGRLKLGAPHDEAPFQIRLVAATLVTRQNKAFIADVDYLRTEIADLRATQPPGHLCVFTDAWRLRFVRTGAAMGWKRLAEIASVARASAIRG